MSYLLDDEPFDPSGGALESVKDYEMPSRPSRKSYLLGDVDDDLISDAYKIPDFVSSESGQKFLTDNPIERRDQSVLDKIMLGIDYGRNIVGSGIAGFNMEDGGFLDKLENAAEWAGQAARNERDVPTYAVKESMGIGYFGENDGNFDIGDIPDALISFGIDIVTDPINWVTLGGASLAKSALKSGARVQKEVGEWAVEELAKQNIKVTKSAEELGEAVMRNAPAKSVRDAQERAARMLRENDPNTFEKIRENAQKTALDGTARNITMGEATVGGLGGLASAPEDATLAERLGYAAGGAGGLVALNAAGGYALDKLGKGFNASYEGSKRLKENVEKAIRKDSSKEFSPNTVVGSEAIRSKADEIARQRLEATEKGIEKSKRAANRSVKKDYQTFQNTVDAGELRTNDVYFNGKPEDTAPLHTVGKDKVVEVRRNQEGNPVYGSQLEKNIEDEIKGLKSEIAGENKVINKSQKRIKELNDKFKRARTQKSKDKIKKEMDQAIDDLDTSLNNKLVLEEELARQKEARTFIYKSKKDYADKHNIVVGTSNQELSNLRESETARVIGDINKELDAVKSKQEDGGYEDEGVGFLGRADASALQRGKDGAKYTVQYDNDLNSIDVPVMPDTEQGIRNARKAAREIGYDANVMDQEIRYITKDLTEEETAKYYMARQLLKSDMGVERQRIFKEAQQNLPPSNPMAFDDEFMNAELGSKELGDWIAKDPKNKKGFDAFIKGVNKETNKLYTKKLNAIKKAGFINDKVKKAISDTRSANKEIIRKLNVARPDELSNLDSLDYHVPSIRHQTTEVRSNVVDDMDRLTEYEFKTLIGLEGEDFAEHMKKLGFENVPKSLDEIGDWYKGQAPESIKKFVDAQIDANKKYHKSMAIKLQDPVSISQYKALTNFYHTMPTHLKWFEDLFGRFNRLASKGLIYTNPAFPTKNYVDNVLKVAMVYGYKEAGKQAVAGIKNLMPKYSGVNWKGRLGRDKNYRHVDDDPLYQRFNRSGGNQSGIDRAKAMEELDIGERLTTSIVSRDNPNRFLEAAQTLEDNLNKILDGEHSDSKFVQLSQKLNFGILSEMIEVPMRFELWKDARKVLQESMPKDIDPNILDSMAHDIVNKPYFDYQNSIGLTEGQYLGKLLGFYSFFKNNMIFMHKVAMNPYQASRAKSMYAGIETGEDEDIKNRDERSDYLNSKRLQRIGGLGGDDKYVIRDYDSQEDYNSTVKGIAAYIISLMGGEVEGYEPATFSGATDAVFSRVSPFINNIANAFGLNPKWGRDTYGERKGYLRLSDQWVLMDAMADAIGNEDFMVVEDGRTYIKSGNPMRTAIKFFDALGNGINAIPATRTFDKIIKEGRDVADGRTELKDAVFNVTGPNKIIENTLDDKNKIRRWNKKQRQGEARARAERGD